MNKQQLAAKIWASANEMRSKIEASEYKDYILGFIFYKFLSEKEEQWLHEQGFDEESIQTVSESNEEIVRFVCDNMGYFIAYENLYSTWLAKGIDFDVSNVTDALSAFSRLINPDHKHVFDRIFETLETGLSKLGDTSGARTKAIRALLNLIKDIPMDGREGYDVLGYIYEYLISNFAANAGKKAGEFYTPHEVSVLMSEIIASQLKDRAEIEIYDPTSGSGSLLITIGQAIAHRTGNVGRIKYYAQELKENTYNLTRMNLVMRGVQPDNISTRNGDTLAEDWPWFEDGHPETYRPLFVDACVSNPPYSQRWTPPEGPDPRFDDYGIAPVSKADYAFLLHNLYHLQPDGIMCIVLPHGVLFRGGEEGNIRRNLIENDKIDAIIGLPANIFFGTGIPTIVMVLRKQRENSDVLIIDASKGFIKEGKNNKLRSADIRRIVDAYENRTSIERFCRVVSKEEIRANDYNLNIPRYVDSSEREPSWDVYALMFGGIPACEIDALDNYWNAFPGLREELFVAEGSLNFSLKSGDLSETVRSNQSVQSYREKFNGCFSDFGLWLYEELIDEATLVVRDTEEDTIAANLFTRLNGIPLIDRYGAYQMLDDEWQAISVDLEIIQTEGFNAVNRVDPNMVTKKKNGKEVEVQEGWLGHVLPFDLVQKMLLTDQMASVSAMERRLESISSEISEIFEELTEEEKTDIPEAINNAGDGFADSQLKGVMKLLRSSSEETNEENSLLSRLEKVSALVTEKKVVTKSLKTAKAELVEQTKHVIEKLNAEEASALLKAKWIDPFVEKIKSIPDNVIDDFVKKLRSLQEKYSHTYADIDDQIKHAETELVAMLAELTGNEQDMAGIHEFAALLGGDL